MSVNLTGIQFIFSLHSVQKLTQIRFVILGRHVNRKSLRARLVDAIELNFGEIVFVDRWEFFEGFFDLRLSGVLGEEKVLIKTLQTKIDKPFGHF